ncbi:MAG: membrane protein insertion efficiency factor YidD [Culicoidibacterales bacterium]
MKFILLKIIQFYQKFISPSLGSNCRFYPSCSEYTKQAVENFGVVKGLKLGLNRINRCSPENSEVGFDPVPETYPSKKTHV